MLQRPPQHRVDAVGIYIDQDDPAWDKMRIEAEIAECGRRHEAFRQAVADLGEGEEIPDDIEAMRPKDHPDAHPFRVYVRGETRYDLAAPIRWGGEDRLVTEWLTDAPTKLRMRRLRWEGWNDCQALSLVSPIRANLRAVEIGWSGVENLPWVQLDPDAKRRTEQEIQELHEINPILPIRFGRAIMRFSDPL